MSIQIGTWVRRGAIGKWHLVESIIEDRAVTHCGRQMHQWSFAGELEMSPVMPLTRMIGQPQNCKRCDRPDPIRESEDDGSTHDELVP